MPPNELLDVTAYGLRSDFLSPETMPKATVELALAKNRKLLLASVLAVRCSLIIIKCTEFIYSAIGFINLFSRCDNLSRCGRVYRVGRLFYYLWIAGLALCG